MFWNLLSTGKRKSRKQKEGKCLSTLVSSYIYTRSERENRDENGKGCIKFIGLWPTFPVNSARQLTAEGVPYANETGSGAEYGVENG